MFLRTLPKTVLSMLATGICAACSSTPPENPAIETIQWATYTNSQIGVSLQRPQIYSISEEEDKNGVIFRYDGFPVMLVRYADEREGRARGLWFKHDPVGEIELAGNKGQKFDYNHYDGPFFMRTISYVIPYRDRYLGLEFRTKGQELDAVQQSVVNSFKITCVCSCRMRP